MKWDMMMQKMNMERPRNLLHLINPGLYLSVIIIILNILDAVLTIWAVKNSIVIEVNPIVNRVIHHMEYAFVIPKVLISGIFGIIITATWDRFKLARIGACMVAGIY